MQGKLFMLFMYYAFEVFIQNTKYLKLFNFSCVKFQKNFKFNSFAKFADSLISLNFALIKV